MNDKPIDHQKLLDKCKIALMMKGSVFLATVAFSMKHKFYDGIPTADTNGLEVRYNPQFFEDLTEEERVGLIAHEAWHVALQHMFREDGKDHEVWNKAGDYVINQLLHDASYDLPSGGLQDNQFRDWSTNQVYDYLMEQDEQKNSGNGDFFCDVREPPKGGDGETDKEAAEKLKNTVKGILVKATNQSKMQGEQAGNIPAEILRELDKLINPILPWETLLDRFLSDHCKDDYSWARPNKRFMPDMIMPSQFSESLGSITIAIDTSGSITDDDMSKILSEITSIKERFNPKELIILDCDYDIHSEYVVTEDMQICDLQFRGGGGTSFQPVIDYCNKQKPQALLYFTDLYASVPENVGEYPILWLCYSEHEPMPIGDTIYYKSKE